MENIYKELGFKQPEILVNPYGIKIYIGTKGDSDWAVEIPKELCKAKCSAFNYDKNFMVYLVTEEDALDVAKEFTEIARKKKGEK